MPDYNVKNNHLLSFGDSQYEVIDEKRRVTAYSDKSSWDNGKLVLKENAIYREFVKHKGVPLYAAITSPGTAGSWNRYLYSLNVYGRSYPDATILGDLKASALTDALDNFHTKVSNRQLLMMEYILERAKVQSMIVDGFKAIVNLRKELDIKRLFKTLKWYNPRTKKIELKRVEMTFAEKWLEYSFGWKPLLADIHTVISGFKPLKSSPIRARGEVTFAKDYNYKDSSTVQLLQTNYKVRCTVIGSVIITDPLLALLDEIGLADPLQIAWNALPFSFVVDWFMNIGSLLDQVSQPGKAIYGTSVTWLVQFDGSSSGHHTMDPPFGGSIANLGSGVKTSIAIYERVPGPLPSPRFTFLKGIDSTWRIITSLALLKILNK